MDVQDKVVVVTGAASGIGAALCRSFKRAGARGLLVADLNEAGARTVADELGALPMKVDVSDEAQVVAMVRAAEAEFGGIDLVCSNAGIAVGDPDPMLVTSASNADFQRSFAVNVMAHVYAARAALPKMIERGHGYFLHTVSAAGLLNQIGATTYTVTKHAAVAFAESLAITHGDHGIKVSILCPQAVRTPMLRGAVDALPQSGDGILEPEAVAQEVLSGLAAERFLILPHPEVQRYVERKAADPQRWLAGMARLRKRTLGLA